MPRRFRFLDTDAFLDRDLIRVLEYVNTLLCEIPYAVVSYPWRDLQISPTATPPEGSFGVLGVEHGDPISIDVLRTICMAVRTSKRSLVWIDRLCILQNNRKDKDWQVQHMYDLYKLCDVCLMVPGGLVRLAKLTDTTSWADRAWTLSEVAAPYGDSGERLKCVFGQEQCRALSLSQAFSEYLMRTNARVNPVVLKSG